jgi:hypothetical protein
VMVLCVLFTCALGFLAFPTTTWETWATVALFLLALVMSVIQYAWTFFYLHLEQLEAAAESGGYGSGPGEAVRTAGGPPRLTVVEGGRRTGGTSS